MIDIHKMVEKEWRGLQARGCTNSDGCANTIKPGEPYFRDEARGTGYCVPCGQRLRYHRKKALQRGEELPLTMADVHARHEAAGV